MIRNNLRELRNQVILDGKLMEGLSSAYREGTVDADEALGRLKVKDEQRTFID